MAPTQVTYKADAAISLCASRSLEPKISRVHVVMNLGPLLRQLEQSTNVGHLGWHIRKSINVKVSFSPAYEMLWHNTIREREMTENANS